LLNPLFVAFLHVPLMRRSTGCLSCLLYVREGNGGCAAGVCLIRNGLRVLLALVSHMLRWRWSCNSCT
jgi:hypothetical protein